MDDVWGNAWSQPEDDITQHLPTRTKVNDLPSWSASSAFSKNDEADVGTPSWSTGELNWTEPSGGSLWSGSAAAEDVHYDGWAAPTSSNSSESHEEEPEPSPFATHFTKLEAEEQGPDAATIITRSSTPQSAETVQPEPLAEEVTEVRVPDVHESPLRLSRPSSPDAFGSFSSGLQHVSSSRIDSNDAWTSSAVDDSAESWGSAWAAPESTEPAAEHVKDEWEIAQEQKARMDRTVPPELLAAILDGLNELTEEIWHTSPEFCFKDDLKDWRKGMDTVEGLEDLRAKYIPDTPIQPPITFTNTRIAKESAQSIKLTKNLPLVRNSPMSHLFTTKSLAAWELSVKSKNYLEKDETPAGWKLPEAEEKETSWPSLSEKKSGGILSFFAKRTSTTSAAPVAADAKRTSLSHDSSESPRSGVSSDSWITIAKAQEVLTIVPKISSPLASPAASTFSVKVGPPSPKAETPPLSTPATKEASIEGESPAPSVLSKFFNRFSKARNDARSRSASPRNSMTLSSNDLEFLSDIIPSHSEDATEEDSLNSLSSFVSSPPIPDKVPPALSPPPLAPPRLTPPLRAPSLVSRGGTSHSRSRSQTPLIDEESIASPPKGASDLMSDLSVLSPSQPAASMDSPSSMSPRDRQKNGAFDFDFESLQPTPAVAPGLSSGLTPPKHAMGKHGSFESFDIIPPTPIEKSPARSGQPVSRSVLDADEFSEFQSHAEPCVGSVPPALSGLAAQSCRFDEFARSSAPINKSDTDFFGDFSSFALTPSPSNTSTPRSPLSPEPGVPPPLPKKQTPANLILHAQKPSAADHESTARLVDQAASHRGRWPAPASPIPEALSPPIPQLSSFARAQSPQISHDSSSSIRLPPPPRQQSIPLKSISQITATSLSRSSTPAISAPSSSTSPGMISAPKPVSGLESLLDFGPPPPPQTVSAPPVPATAKPAEPTQPMSYGSGKGLSAQDLSFFEGL